MLRRVKKDVISEMTNKKEVVVPCSLSSRQQAFYQAIKNKISVADLFGNGGQLNDKKVLNLMNIVIQLRKVILFSYFNCKFLVFSLEHRKSQSDFYFFQAVLSCMSYSYSLIRCRLLINSIFILFYIIHSVSVCSPHLQCHCCELEMLKWFSAQCEGNLIYPVFLSLPGLQSPRVV